MDSSRDSSCLRWRHIEQEKDRQLALTIYEVVSGGTKAHCPPGGEDWSVLVAAGSPTEARDIAYRETEVGRPWVIYEWGIDGRQSAEPGILRGPFKHYPAVCLGWKVYIEDPDDEAERPRVVECDESMY